jgi:arginine deiminase
VRYDAGLAAHEPPAGGGVMVRVTSEIGRLRRVLMHEPGPEVDRMVPAMMEELLFDDILFGDVVREEHGRFRQLLKVLGVEVVEAAELVRTALEEAGAREWLLQAMTPDLPESVRDELAETTNAELMARIVCGIRHEAGRSGGGIDALYRLPPLVNWCFQRDPQVVIGERVLLSAMATAARWREGLLARLAFRYHPELAGTPVLSDPLRPDVREPLVLGLQRPCLEGGDVLVVSRDIVAVGVSERTNTQAVEQLAHALAAADAGPRWLLVVHLPQRRAYMHLDTVLTMIDQQLALVHVPVILPGRGETAEVSVVDLESRELRSRAEDDLLAALARCGLDLEPVPCGGDDPVAQLREQWTDGANCVALAPGVIVLYDRNVRTAEALDARGFRILRARDVLLGRESVDLDAAEKTCILLSSHEISRARGGPHCLTHPLLRDDV